MYGVAISLILLFPWALVALASVWYLRSRRVPFQLDGLNLTSVPHAMVATARNGKVAIASWNGTRRVCHD